MHALDFSSYSVLREQRANAAFGIGSLLRQQWMQPIAELCNAPHVVLAVERMARAAHIVGFDLDHCSVA